MQSNEIGTIRERITRALKDAQQENDESRLPTLRLLATAIQDRDMAARLNGQSRVGDEALVEILHTMIEQRQRSMRDYEAAGHVELLEQERTEAQIIQSILPQRLSVQEAHHVCREAIKNVGASRLRDKAACLAYLKEKYGQKIDTGLVTRILGDMIEIGRAHV